MNSSDTQATSSENMNRPAEGVPNAAGLRAVDLFAGWGGFTLGAEQAGAQVVWAANHWPLAVQAHALNHPHTVHACQDLRQADWTQLPEYDVLLAAPACQGHSQASQPKRRLYHDALRATAWAVIDCAEVTQPQAIIVENVPDFLRWKLYRHWRGALSELGYRVSEQVVDATHHGVPQRRKRVFIIACREKLVLYQQPRRTAEPAFGPHVQWTEGSWKPIHRAATKARGRIELARAAHGPRCLVQHVTGHAGISLDEPVRTITCQDQWAAVDGDLYRPLTIRETARAMGFPDNYVWPKSARRDAIKGLGNAVCPPVARDLVSQLAGAL